MVIEEYKALLILDPLTAGHGPIPVAEAVHELPLFCR